MAHLKVSNCRKTHKEGGYRIILQVGFEAPEPSVRVIQSRVGLAGEITIVPTCCKADLKQVSFAAKRVCLLPG